MLTVKHWTVDLTMFVILLVNYSGQSYCVCTKQGASKPQRVCGCVYVCVPQILDTILGKQLKSQLKISHVKVPQGYTSLLVLKGLQ